MSLFEGAAHLHRQRLVAVGQSLDLRYQTLQLGICQSFVHGDWGIKGVRLPIRGQDYCLRSNSAN